MNITYKVIVDENGTQFWFLDDKLHRTDGPAVIWTDGKQQWFLNGKRHRIDGPAVIYADGTQQWWLDDKRHRVDGPAVIWTDGTQKWFLDGVKMSQEEYAARTAPVKELTVAEIEILLGHKVKIVKG